MKRIIGIGNALVDILIQLDSDTLLTELGLPKGSMTLVDRAMSRRIIQSTRKLEKRQSSGGSAANTISGLARLGVPTGFIGVVGKDSLGEVFSQDLQAGTITNHLRTISKETGHSISLISRDTERTFATFLGAAGDIDARHISPDLFRSYDYLLLEGYLLPKRGLMERILEAARETDVRVVLDFSSYNVVEENRDYLESVLKRSVDIALANRDEARIFTGFSDPELAAADISCLCDVAVVKCGAEGSWILRGSARHFVPAIPVRALDTTGAGDLYAAGFLFGLLNGHPLDICGHLGSILGGKVVEVLGAKMDAERWTETMGLVRDRLPG